ncbi:MAG: hypothetical protein M3186_05645 [Actinomycetota bacterium]|nr:hypothetical protein [Actinomycetota bacterium]
MSTRIKAILVTLAVAIPAFLLVREFFPPPPGPGPSSGQLPFFIVLSALDSLLLGAGIAFIAFGWPMVRRVGPASRAGALAIYVTLAWLMVSWYPHIGLHTSVFGSNFAGLLVIDYVFHVPLFIAPLVLIWAFAGLLDDRSRDMPTALTEDTLSTR